MHETGILNAKKTNLNAEAQRRKDLYIVSLRLCTSVFNSIFIWILNLRGYARQYSNNF